MVAGGSEGGWGIAGGAVGCVQDGRAAASRRFVDRRSPGSPVKVTNVHERLLPASPARVGQPLDSLAGPDDRLWPSADWPPMRLDRPLQVGAAGGNGPIRYEVEAYDPGRRVQFRARCCH